MLILLVAKCKYSIELLAMTFAIPSDIILDFNSSRCLSASLFLKAFSKIKSWFASPIQDNFIIN